MTTITQRTLDITSAVRIDGYMSELELTWLALAAMPSRLIAEIGSWQGRSTRALAAHTSGTVFAIDHWRGSPGIKEPLDALPQGWLFKRFMQNVFDLDNVVPVRSESVAAASTLSGLPFDLIFIDGGHDYQEVKNDIRAWRPLVIPGGVLCGHDYGNPCGVKQAVDELLPGAKVADGTSIWFIRL